MGGREELAAGCFSGVSGSESRSIAAFLFGVDGGFALDFALDFAKLLCSVCCFAFFFGGMINLISYLLPQRLRVKIKFRSLGSVRKSIN